MSTPKSITLTIDGKRCTGTAGQTILDVANAHHIFIPTLCFLKQLSPWGGCRICIVEVAGNPKVVPACSTPAADGSIITTQSERLQHLRRCTLELLFSERNHICPFCPMNKGDCELQMRAYQHGMDSVRFQYLYPAQPVDLSGPHFGIDHNRCILCTRCVRTCDEQEGVHTLDVGFRGSKNRIVVDMNKKFSESETCTQCGACVAACPTGALFDKAQAFRGKLNTCRTVKTTCSECPIGCGLMVFTKEQRIVQVFGDPEAAVNHGHLCVRGRYETWATTRTRIVNPMIRRNGALKPVSWDEAIAFVKKQKIAATVGQAGLLVSPRLTNEAAKTAGGLVKQFERSGVFVAHNETGLCAPPEHAADSLNRIDAADCILLLGTQPSRDHGVLAARIRVAVRKRDAKLLIFHARKSDLDAYATVCANVVSLERSFWNSVADVLRDAQRPVLVYGPEAMSPIGVTVLERLLKTFEAKTSGEAPALVAVPRTTNSRSVVAAGLEPLEEIGPWLDHKPLKFLHVVAGDEPDGGARLLEERHVPALLEQVDCLVVQAAYPSALTEMATVVLPTAAWAEKTGTITNFEGNDLPVRAIVPARGEAREDQTILEALFA